MTILEIQDQPNNIVFVHIWSEHKNQKYGLLMLPPKLGTFMAISLISMKLHKDNNVPSQISVTTRRQQKEREREVGIMYGWGGRSMTSQIMAPVQMGCN